MKLLAICWMLLALMGAAQGQPTIPAVVSVSRAGTAQSSVEQWLLRLQEVASQGAYVGTFVLTAGNHMSSARIWHVCEGSQQIERVEALTGVRRSIFRRNDQVMTYLPESRVAIAEKRTSLGLFPNLLKRADSSIGQHYQLVSIGQDRVAGMGADVVQLVPRDGWRFGYRVWTEQTTGMVIKLQTLDARQTVLEQAAFSDLQMAQPLSWAKLSAMMDKTDGYLIKKPELVSTSADQQGWHLKADVPGFKSISCHKRLESSAGVEDGAFQWVFSDGLATVSLFIEAFDATRHMKLQHHDDFAIGATQVQTRRIGDWWLTVVGEVPQLTLQRFAQSLERKIK